MPGSAPPILTIPESDFDALNPLSYNSTNKAFENLGGTLYYLFVQKKTGGDPDEGEWFHDTDSGGGINPRGQIPQLTYDVISGGTWNSGAVDYSGKTYKFRLERDVTGGIQIANAVEV